MTTRYVQVHATHILADNVCVQSTNPLPFPLILANCVAWVSYAYVKQDIFVFLANDTGIMMGMFFTLSAYGVANPKVGGPA